MRLPPRFAPFVGRVLDWHHKAGDAVGSGADDPGVQSVRRIHEYYRQFGQRTEVMGASFRSTAQTRLALNGAAFRLMLNDDAMAGDKLAEGIRGCCVDSALLEQMIVERIGACKKV